MNRLDIYGICMGSIPMYLLNLSFEYTVLLTFIMTRFCDCSYEL